MGNIIRRPVGLDTLPPVVSNNLLTCLKHDVLGALPQA